MKNYWVYGLNHPSSPDSVCYVGVTTNCELRLKTHRSERKTKFEMEILDNFPSFNYFAAQRIESFWMLKIERRYGPLLNTLRNSEATWYLTDEQIETNIERYKKDAVIENFNFYTRSVETMNFFKRPRGYPRQHIDGWNNLTVSQPYIQEGEIANEGIVSSKPDKKI